MDVQALLGLLRRRWLAVLVCTVAGVLGAALVTRAAPAEYRATTRLLVSIPDTRTVEEAARGVQLSSQLLESYARIATSRRVADQTAGALEGVDGATVRRSVTAEVVPETLLLDIAAVQPGPARARDVANGAAGALIATIAELEADRQNPVTARVIDAATAPGAPVNPSTSRNAALGGALGVTVGLGVALLLDALDRSVRSAPAAGAASRRPVLTVVPRWRRRSLAMVAAPASPSADAYRTLRAALATRTGRARTVLVTSPGPGDGKTATAANLAAALGEAGERVVLVDADLRTGGLTRLLEVDAERGVSDVLAGHTSPGQAMWPWAVGPWADLVWVLPAGRLPENAAQLQGRGAVADLLARLRGDGDVVVLDGPPVLAASETGVLASKADAVLFVARYGHTRADDLTAAAERLAALGADVAGCVLLGVPRGAAGGTYGEAVARSEAAGADPT